MADYLSAIIQDHPALLKILQALAIPASDIRFVGGCVRDAILGRSTHDIDLATTYLPEAVMAQGRKAGLSLKPTGLAHGTVSLFHADFTLEITTLRKDIACDGRHATVAFTSDWQEDAARRDFTINAMSLDLNGQLYDYFHGQEDLAQGIVRFIGDASTRIEEDALRILRYFRFLSRYGNNHIHPEALAACENERHRLDQLSGERIHNECWQLLGFQKPLFCFQAMYQIGLFPYLFLAEASLSHLAQLEQFEEAYAIAPSPLLRLATLLTPELLPSLFKRWRLSRASIKYITTLFELNEIMRYDEPFLQTLLLNHDRALVVDALFFAAAKHSHPSLAIFEAAYRYIKQWTVPFFPLQGQDLLDAGLAAGPRIGQLLKEAHVYWHTHDYQPPKEELLAYLLKGPFLS